MNKNYRIIWNYYCGQVVVASEFASGHGKNNHAVENRT